MFRIQGPMAGGLARGMSAMGADEEASSKMAAEVDLEL